MAKLVYECPLTGTLYAEDDPRLVGTGNPPSIPLAPGQGTCQLVPRLKPDAAKVADPGEARTFPADYIQRASASIK